MYSRIFKLLSVFIAVLLTVSMTTAAFAAQDGGEPAYQTTLITVRATEIKAKGAFKAIQTALNSAHYSATRDNIFKIKVEEGYYELRTALHIYSNTTLSLGGVTLKRSSESISNMLRTGDDTAVNKGGTGYTPNSNITVEGGTFDGGGTTNTVIKVTHASDFKMIGCNLVNVKNAHMMEVAAVDGFQVRNCSFKNQVMDATAVGYEAVQLDIPKDGHIVGCRSEALSIRNVHIEGCVFDNVPRAVGSHTQILNAPLENIVITNNIFKNLKSVAIQGENWKDVTISGNRIENAPRAISLYSIVGNNGGGFKAGVLAKEGGVKTSVSEKYQQPYEANIVISDNTITNCGTVKDIYADYRPLAISVIGKNVTSVSKANEDGSGNYPKGDYYIDGVTVKNNSIETAGHAVYLEDVRNATVSGNKITCTKNKIAPENSNPLTTLTSTVDAISNNEVTSAPYYGFELAESTIGRISGNSISSVGKDGIILEAQSTVKDGIYNNIINKTGANGINIRPKSAAGNIEDNIIVGCKKAIQQEKTATASVGSNYYKLAELTSLELSETDVTLGEGEKLTLKASYSPVNAIARFSWSSSAPSVAGVNENGSVTALSYGDADITVKSANGKTAVCHVKVRPAPQSIKLSETMLTIGVGESVDLGASLPDGTVSRQISYISNNTSSVSAGSDGVITGVGTGTATVVAKTFNGKHACCNVIVRQAPYDIWFDSRELALGVGEMAALSLNLPEGAASNSIVYKSSDPDVVSVEQHGVIRAKTNGTAVITATAFNGVYASCTVSVMNEPTGVSFYQKEYTLSVGEEFKLDPVFPEGCASNAVSFQSSDPDVCRIDKNTGELTLRAPGTVTITVKTYNRVSATCKVTVVE